jgi:hypothetical protein
LALGGGRRVLVAECPVRLGEESEYADRQMMRWDVLQLA